MKRIIPFLVCFLLGVGIGWYFSYTRPVAKHQRELLRQYQDVKRDVQMTDAEMAEAGRRIPQYFEDVKRQDELAAIFALEAFKDLERGDTEETKRRLLQPIGSYYREYHEKGGDPILLAKIEGAAQEYPAVAAEISRENE